MSRQKEVRNSSLRKISNFFLDPVVNTIVKIPGVTANKVTATGTILVSAGVSERIVNPEKTPWVALALIGLGVFCDALDGQVARRLGQASQEGALFDLLNDRFQETVMSLSRIAMACQRNDPLGVLAATLAGLTNPLPSLMRAKVEEKGGAVQESGKNPLSFSGTRAGRVMIGVPATVFPESFYAGPLAFQALADLLTSIANISSSLERKKDLLTLSRETKEMDNDDDLSHLGRKKTEVLKKFTLINSLITLSAGAIGLLTTLSR